MEVIICAIIRDRDEIKVSLATLLIIDYYESILGIRKTF